MSLIHVHTHMHMDTLTHAATSALIPLLCVLVSKSELDSTFFPWSISMAEQNTGENSQTHMSVHAHNESIFSLFYPNVSRGYARLKALLLMLSIQNKYSEMKKASKSYSSTPHMLLTCQISFSVFRWHQKTGGRVKGGRYVRTETAVQVQ